MFVGVDYYPEYWPAELMDEDIDGIVKLGSNMVRIGEFSWHLMEKEEGAFDFSFFDGVIAKLKNNGLSVMFGTPTATFPAWLAKKHPSILSKDETGGVRAFGGRRQYCFNSDIYFRYSSLITRKLVAHYSDEPAVVSWQIDNEFGHEGSDMCFCDQCHSGFQQFLERKFGGDIALLNETYGTIFWGQTYNAFSEIPLPTKTITVHNPALQLDWARFRSYSVNRFGARMAAIVREEKGQNQSVTTNLPGGFFDKWYDHAEHAEALDFVSYDNYPVWGGLAEPITPAAIALGHDFNRGLKGANFWIVEELMGAQGHDVIGYLPRPNQARMWSMQAFAHGCSDLLYFSWRAMTRGAEQFCMGIVDHDNRRGRKYEEVQSVFRDIRPYADVLQSEIKADVAVLYDYDNIWSWRIQRQSGAFDFRNELLRLYTPFHSLNCRIDVIPVSRDFGGYKVLVVPALQMIDKALGERLATFARDGGTVVFSFRTGIRDKDNNVYFGMELPGYAAEMSGVVIRGSEAIPAGCSVPVVPAAAGWEAAQDSASACEVWRDLLTPTTAEVLYRYDDPFFPEAAVTRNRFGSGTVYYIGGGMGEEILDRITRSIVNERDIWHIKSDKGVEVVLRESGERKVWFVLNHTGDTQSFQGQRLNPYESRIVEAGRPLF
ncbi:beta-galactosidase [Paenibacillus sp. sptzw28]|uniref:beta-galactosidase n=1 Tax=Paenibacillus sp. sptzw28 TaxID=715179 RepID=UPI001C6E3741|nr:beta-galactosidase [Paenibacillus sp. sptzw28]QYR21464.1 beta-galactosidase [Paenibacillus sp. sptzw28]